MVQQLIDLKGMEARGAGALGAVFFEDGSFLPGVMLDFSDLPASEECAEALYAFGKPSSLFTHINGEGVVELSGFRNGEDSTLFEAAFVPDKLDDVDAFVMMLSVADFWVFTIRLSYGELRFVVSSKDDKVVEMRRSRRRSEIRCF